ncbi:MAG: cyclic nucleotide-binding domain-containing protein [Planctomycetota bacterium]
MHTLLHIANILYVASYSVRDILWLRAISVVAMMMLCGVYACRGAAGDSEALYWQGAFIVINIVQIVRLLRERRPVNLTSVEKRMHETALKSLSPQQVRRLMSKADWKEVADGQTIIDEGVQNQNLLLLTDGKARVTVAGRQVAALMGGQFVGEMSFLTGSKTSAKVCARGTVKLVTWTEDMLRETSEKDGGLGAALQAALGADLVWKLLDQRSRQVRGTALDSMGTVTLPAT